MLAAKGGCGATTVATNLAVSLASFNEMHPVALVDFNLYSGDVPAFLDISPRHTIVDISKNIERLDSDFLMGVLTRHVSGVYVLPSPGGSMDMINPILPGDISKTLNIMRDVFDFTIVDAHCSFDPVDMTVFDLSDIILLISTLDVLSMRNAKRLMYTFFGLSYSEDKIKLVVNRYTKDSEIPLKEVEKRLKCKAFWLIPNDYPTVISSIDQGHPFALLYPDTAISKSFRTVASAFKHQLTNGVQKEAEADKPGFLFRLFRRKKD